MDTKRELLRHAVATVAYRGAKVLRDVPPEFAQFQASPATRTPIQILGHLGDLFEWADSLASGAEEWVPELPLTWDAGVDRFFESLQSFDELLAAGRSIACTEERLLQGPVADALWHIGQIAMLRGMAGCKIRGENYFRATVTAGTLQRDQAPPAVEFD